MTPKYQTKINKLISTWPNGLPYTQKYLTILGYNHDLVHHYLKSSWLKALGHGVFTKQNDAIDWMGGLAATQQQLGKNIHAGARTALMLQGISHYARFQQDKIFLLGKEKQILPKWFLSFEKESNYTLICSEFLDYNIQDSFDSYNAGNFRILISSKERAILETLYLIPNKQGFDEAYKLFEMLPALRPDILQALLDTCRSKKVMRLFLFMAKRLTYPWYDLLKTNHLDLGSGKRVLVKNGILNKEFLITVPKEYSK